MKRKNWLIGLLILLVSLGFILLTDTREVTDQEWEQARIYSKGYSDGYLQRQKDYEWEAEIWKRRYLILLERTVNN